MARCPIKDQSGISILELLVAVGILTAIATIGQNQYQHYRLKAMDGESKSTLMQLYTKMTVFRSHYGIYFADFRNIGFECQGWHHARIGFWNASGAAGPDCPSTYRGPGAVPGNKASLLNTLFAVGCRERRTICQLIPICRFSATDFTACASRKTADYDLTKMHLITIDENKSFTQGDTSSNCQP